MVGLPLLSILARPQRRLSCQTGTVNPRVSRLTEAQLYLVCDEQSDSFLRAALRGGVDIVQLRMKRAGEAEIVAAGKRFRQITREHDALLIINDRPELVSEVDADGAHLGQDDLPTAPARQILGPDRLLGLSTHSREQIDAAVHAGVDYIGVGPVNETPTKPGRAAVGLELVAYAAEHAAVPFFAIGGISAANVDAVRAAGAERVAVVRALTETADPERTAGELCRHLTREQEARVGA
jgi:thiamine-phosphate pyrophosphorylase